MTSQRVCILCLVVSGVLAAVTWVPMGNLEVFEYKTVDVRFWVRKWLQHPQPRQHARVVLVGALDESPSPLHEPGDGGPADSPKTSDADAPWSLLASHASTLAWATPRWGPSAAALADPALERPEPQRVDAFPQSIMDPGAGSARHWILGARVEQQHLSGAGSPDPAYIQLAEDLDGVVRWLPLMVERDGRREASFVLQMICAYDRVDPDDTQVVSGEAILRRGGQTVRRIPVDSQTRMQVNYRERPADDSVVWSRVRSTLDVPLARDLFAERIVLFGSNLRGVSDFHSTPLAVHLPEVEVLAEAVETILAGTYINRVGHAATYLITWALLFGGALLMVRLRSWHAVAIGFAFMFGYIAIAQLAFMWGGVWLDFIRPMLALQAGVAIFPVFAYRGRSHKLVAQMRVLRRFDDLVLTHMAKGLLAAGRHGMVLRHNPRAAELLGLPGESLHGRHIRELFAVSPGMLEILGRAMAESHNGAHATRKLPISSRVSLPGGETEEERILELEVALIDANLMRSGEDENQPCFVLTFDDVTQQVQSAQEEARRARLAAMGEIAAKLGHEIRNSLGGLRLYVENISEEIPTDSGGGRAIEGMIREIETLSRKSDELREYGREPSLELVRCDLKSLLEEALNYASHRLGEKRVRAVLDCESRIPPVIVDRRQMRDAFQNLINNAIDAAPEGGRVAITAECVRQDNGASGCSHCIHFEDNGPGISQDVQEHVFSLFTTKPEIGTGLGLPIVKKIVESHGGSISFECGAEQGTRFTIKLPARQGSGETKP